MTSDQTPGAGKAWALAAAGLALAMVGVVLRLRTPAPAPARDLGRMGEQAHARIAQALESQARALEPKASTAGRIHELVAALDMDADRATCQDLLDNEDWWATYRTSFALSAVISDRTLALVGPEITGLAEGELVRLARERGVASGILAGKARAFIAAAARISPSKRSGPAPIVLVGTVLDGAALKRVADLTGDWVGLSDGTKLLEAGGPAEPGRVLASLVGRETAGTVAIADGRAGAAWPAGEGIWLLAAFTAPPEPRPPENGGVWLLIAGAAVAAAGGALVVFRPRSAPVVRRPVDHPAAHTKTASLLARDAGAGARSHPGQPSTVRGGDEPDRPRSVAATAVAPSRAAPTPAAAVAPAAQNPSPSARSHMGRYELIELIGEGGMAEIFFAAARGAENFVRYFVVKRMHPHLARSQEAVNQFIDEGRLQAGLVHSNIVPVFDFGKAGGEYFLALEYIHGRDVGQIVQRHVEQLGRPLDVGVAFYIVHDVLEALSYAHAQVAKDGVPMDIVHRDVSPGNVLVSYRGEVKLTDFGIAKSDKRVSRTEVGMVKGNASFMSPEQARGEPVDLRSDIFSAGLVLFYCLTNEFLYRGETTLNRLLRAAVGPATSQFDHIDQLPLAAAKVLRRALALDPDKRYGSAAEFARDLTANMAGRSDLGRLMDVLFPQNSRRDLR